MYEKLLAATMAVLVVAVGAAAAVPGFVSCLHGTIQNHLTGALDGTLGESVRDLVGGDAGDRSDGGGNDDAVGDTDTAPA